MKSIVPLIIDSQLHCGDGSPSLPLLTVSLGGHSVLDYLVTHLSELSAAEPFVMPSFDAPAGYDQQILGTTRLPVRLTREDRVGSILGRLEAADHLLVIDPRYWPLEGHVFDPLVTGLDEYHGATHLVCVRVDFEEVQERIECDTDGSVQCIQRLYGHLEWPETAGKAIAYTLAPARAVTGIRFRTLSELRAGLLARGGLNRDLPLNEAVLDLSSPQALLALNDRLVGQLVASPTNDRFSVYSTGVLVGHNCQIHPSVRFVPPVVVRDGAIVEESAMVIGPTLIGPRCRIGRGTTVAQSLLNNDTAIAPETIIRHQVCCGRVTDSQCGGDLSTRAVSMTSLPSEWRWVREMEVLAENTVGLGRKIQFAVKRLLDIALAFPAMVVLAIPMAIVALLIKLDSAGPVFFTHRREGRGGKDFPCLKFRTMSADAHKMQRRLYEKNELDGPQFKLKQDPRVTRIGRLLRVTNIDELPQLLNVLAGQMSLVGPRPSPFRENQICVPWRLARLSVRPGITGLWQVCRDENRTEGDFHEWIFFDINYVRHFSVWLDLKIIAATFLALLGWRIPLAYLIPLNKQTGSVRVVTGSTAVRRGEATT